MSKFKLTYAGDKILEFHEVQDELPRDFYEEASDVSQLLQVVKENNLFVDDDHKLALRYTEQSNIKEIFLVLKDNPLPSQYFFKTEKEALDFANQQGLKESVHLLSPDKKDIVKQFFNGEECKFPGFKKIKENYEQEIERSGGESCTQCAKNRIMKKYQDLILDALQENPSNNFSQHELSKTNKNK
jgi:hypothetical protein